MSKKLFTLIYGDHIHAAPGAKIVPAEDFSTLLESSEMLAHVQKDALRYRQEVTKECEILKERAQSEGYEAGFKAWSEQLARLEQEIKSVHAEIQKIVIPVALKAAKKIVARELELSQAAIIDIVKATLKTVSQHKKVTVYVNRKDLEILDQHKRQLREVFENLEALSIRERDDVQPGGCVVETEIGIINAQIEHRWKILEKAFEALGRVVN